MYKNGRLAKDVREKLTRIYEKERAKDSILNKFDRKYGKDKSAEDTEPVKVSVETRAAAPAVEKKTAPAVNAPPVETESEEFADTPKRTRVLEQRKAAEALSGDLNWVSMIRYNQKETKREIQMMEDLAEDAKNMLKKDLERQITIRRTRHAKDAKEKEIYQKQYNDDHRRFCEEEDAKTSGRHKRVMQLKKMREDQIKDLEKRRTREASKLHRREQREAARVRAEIEGERQKDLRRKAEHKKMMKQVLKENDEQDAIKRKQREAEEAEAVRLQKEYIKSLDAAERAKKEALEATMQAQEKKLAALMDSTAKEREANRLAEERAERQRVVKQQAKDAELDARDAKRRADMEDCKRVIAAQIREKEDRIRQEIEEDREYGQKLKDDTDRAVAEEEAKQARRRGKAEEQAKFIQEQVEAVERRKLLAMAEMSQTEAAMNKDLLDCVLTGKSMIRKPKINPAAPFEWRYKKTSKPF